MKYTYRHLLSEREFLKVRLRARQLKLGTDLVAIMYKDRKLVFKTASGTYGRRVYWFQTIEITDAYLENLLNNKKFNSIESLIKDSGLKIGCSCASFLYWGYKYMAWKRGYGLEKETRRPVIRNPHERGFVCFVAGTKVLSESGYKNIEDLEVGDRVISHKGVSRAILAKSSRFVVGTTILKFNGKYVESTWDHPYMVLENHIPVWKLANTLEAGDLLLCPSEFSNSKKRHIEFNGISYTCIAIEATDRERSRREVFNIEVEEDESYIVNGAIVHNCKHLYLVLSCYPFWSKTLASKFKNWAESKQVKQAPEKTKSIKQEPDKAQEDKQVTESEEPLDELSELEEEYQS